MRCPSCGTDNAPDSRFCGGCGARLAVSGQRVAPTQKISDDASFPQRQVERQVTQSAGSAVPITAPGVVAPRAVPATPFLPQGVPPAQRPLAGGSAAPARSTTAPVGPQSSPRPPAVVMEDPRDATRTPSINADPRDATRGGVNRPALPGEPPADGKIGPLWIDPALSLPIAARRPWTLIVVVLVIDLGLAAAGIWMLAHGLGDRASRAAPPRSGALDPGETFPSPRTVPAGAVPAASRAS
jgi:hypothetical protein